MAKRIIVLISAIAAIALPNTGFALDCAKARTETERAICRSPRLATLDEELNRAYAKLAAVVEPAQKKQLSGSQARWLSERNDCRGGETCLVDSMTGRIRRLTAQPETGANPGGLLALRANTNIDPARPELGQDNEVVFYSKPVKPFEHAWNAEAAKLLASRSPSIRFSRVTRWTLWHKPAWIRVMTPHVSLKKKRFLLRNL